MARKPTLAPTSINPPAVPHQTESTIKSSAANQLGWLRGRGAAGVRLTDPGEFVGFIDRGLSVANGGTMGPINRNTQLHDHSNPTGFGDHVLPPIMDRVRIDQ
jgi:hypothetical protein